MCRQSFTSLRQIIPPDGELGHLARSGLLINLVDIPSREIRESLNRAPLSQIVDVTLRRGAYILGTCPGIPQYVPPLEILLVLSLLERQISETVAAEYRTCSRVSMSGTCSKGTRRLFSTPE